LPKTSVDAQFIAPCLPKTSVDVQLIAPCLPKTSVDAQFIAPCLPKTSVDVQLIAPCLPKTSVDAQLIAPVYLCLYPWCSELHGYKSFVEQGAINCASTVFLLLYMHCLPATH